MPKIRTLKELQDLRDDLYAQGFGHINDYHMHDAKLNKIIWEANTLRMTVYESELKEKFKLCKGSYEKFEELMKQHFATFNEDDKIQEIIHTVRPLTKNTKNWGEKIWVMHKNHIILSGKYNGYRIKELMRLLGFTEVEKDKIYVAGARRITREDFDNGSVKLKGDIFQLNTLYEGLRNNYAKERNNESSSQRFSIEKNFKEEQSLS